MALGRGEHEVGDGWVREFDAFEGLNGLTSVVFCENRSVTPTDFCEIRSVTPIDFCYSV